MAMLKISAQRLFSFSKISSQSLMNCRISSSSMAVRTRIPHKPGDANVKAEPGDAGILRRLFHEGALIRPEILQMPMGGDLMEKLREIDVRLAPPVSEEETVGLSVEDARKLLRAAQIEVVKSRLREIGMSWIPYMDFVRVCREACSDPELGSRIAKMLDECGNVIVLGNSVCLRPDQVTKSVEGLLPMPHVHNPNDPRRKELKELEAQKAVLDGKAHALVRRELWAGLGYLIVQTVGFMRLTFWELTWDVMEPICFYVTSMYFMACYAFFLRTSREPSFEGFYSRRFEGKQKKLFLLHDFDFRRYDELKRMFYPMHSTPPHRIFGSLHN